MSDIRIAEDYKTFLAALPDALKRKLSFHDLRNIKKANAAWVYDELRHKEICWEIIESHLEKLYQLSENDHIDGNKPKAHKLIMALCGYNKGWDAEIDDCLKDLSKARGGENSICVSQDEFDATVKTHSEAFEAWQEEGET